MKLLPLAIACLACFLLLPGCGGGGSSSPNPDDGLPVPIRTKEEAMKHGAWTVLVYLDGDNDLEKYAIANFNQMEQIGSSADVRVIVQFDRAPGFDSTNGNWTDTRRFLVTRDTDTNVISSLRLDDPPMGEADMGSPDTLRNFVQWGRSTFPADHYALIVWDHGTGWEIHTLTEQIPYKYIALDSTSGNALDVPEIKTAMSGLRVDVLAFDACFMQEMEVAYELRTTAKYMVGSSSAVPAYGYDYNLILRGLRGTTTPEGLGRLLVDDYMARYPEGYKGITHSLIDLDQMDILASAASNYSVVLMDYATAKADELKSARDSSLDYSTIDSGPDRQSRDMLEYAGLAASAIGTPADTAYAALADAFGRAVLVEKHNSDTPTARGLSIYIPPSSAYNFNYGLLEFSHSTTWDEWLQAQVK